MSVSVTCLKHAYRYLHLHMHISMYTTLALHKVRHPAFQGPPPVVWFGRSGEGVGAGVCERGRGGVLLRVGQAGPTQATNSY